MKGKLEEIKKVGKELVELEKSLVEELYDKFSRVLTTRDSVNIEMYFDEDTRKVVLQISISFGSRTSIKKMVKIQHCVMDYTITNLSMRPIEYAVDDINKTVSFEFIY